MRRAGMLLVCAAVAALAAPAHAATLDGVRHTRHAYDGSLSEPVVTSGDVDPASTARKASSPEPRDCSETSCHRSQLVLRVPRGIDTGALTFRVDPRPAVDTEPGYADTVAYGVYDARGRRIAYWAPTAAPPLYNRPQDVLEARPATAARPLVVSRLAPGRYLLVVYNLGGPTSFAATVTWEANKPSRDTP